MGHPVCFLWISRALRYCLAKNLYYSLAIFPVVVLVERFDLQRSLCELIAVVIATRREYVHFPLMYYALYCSDALTTTCAKASGR